MAYHIQKYAKANQDKWDDFILHHSANGTIFHTQSFLSYHPENRFEDASILIYKEEVLICVLATCKTESGFYSHLGTSCGGPIFHRDFYKSQEVYLILDLIQKHYQYKLSMRLCESSLTQKGNDLLLFFLSKTHNTHPELSVHIPISNTSVNTLLRNPKAQKQVQRLLGKGLSFVQADRVQDYEQFHIQLSKNLEKYQTSPTHSLEDLLTLKSTLGNKQVLFLVKDENEMIHGGVWAIHCSNKIWHTQYIVKNYESSYADIILALLFKLVIKLENQGTTVLNLGISTEQKGSVLNQSLIQFKEKFYHRHEMRYTLTPKENPLSIKIK
jgi:hypothetical protein